MKSSKGQSGGGAAALIAIIALAVILYVIFLPSDIRQELLDADDLSGDTNATDITKAEYRLVLEESPGRLDTLNLRDCVGSKCNHEINSFTLFKTTDSEVIKEENPFMVKNNIMTKQSHTVNFELMDAKNTDNLILTFNARKHEGILKITLNGNVLFEKDIDSFNPNPITIPTSILSKYNVLDFEVSKVGPAFWKTNEYSIEGFRIIGDITDTSRQTSNNVFYVSDSEYFNLESGKLKFSPDCVQSRVGMLQIVVNGRELFYGVPDCQILNVIPFNPSYFEKGENTLSFKTDEGSYLLDLIEIETTVKDVTYPVYYFELEKDEIDWIKDEDANLTVTFEFVDNFRFEDDYDIGEEYEIIFTVNGHKKYMSTYDEDHSRIISYPDLREKDNWIKVQPKSGFVDIAKMKLEVIPND